MCSAEHACGQKRGWSLLIHEMIIRQVQQEGVFGLVIVAFWGKEKCRFAQQEAINDVDTVDEVDQRNVWWANLQQNTQKVGIRSCSLYDHHHTLMPWDLEWTLKSEAWTMTMADVGFGKGVTVSRPIILLSVMANLRHGSRTIFSQRGLNCQGIWGSKYEARFI